MIPNSKNDRSLKWNREAPVAPAVPEAGMRADRMVAAAAPMDRPKQRRMKSFAPKKEVMEMRPERVNFDERMRELKAVTITSEKETCLNT